MAVELIPPGFPDPVQFSRRIGGTSPPKEGEITRAVPSPTSYLDTSGLALAGALSKDAFPDPAPVATYRADGSQGQATAPRGSKINITA